jgi:hypothetical protein
LCFHPQVDDKPVFIEEFFPLGLSPAISISKYMQLLTEVVAPRARAYTTYFCPTTPGMMQQYMYGKDWLALVAAYASNATAQCQARWT